VASPDDTRAETRDLLEREQVETEKLWRGSVTNLGFEDETRDIHGDRAYRVLEEIGHGGMGAVYLAERADGAYRQRVAIKRIREGLGGHHLIQRFRTERQILAALDHPSIAKLLDGGTLADGTPFLVMEYIEGISIDAYCREKQLDLRQRLEVFLKVCDAVAAAHRRLIVHRDLKPGNILVQPDGNPKLLDFGIAKLLDAKATDWTVFETETGRVSMTMRYASPEQVQGEIISTATDIYSLGVILYELLTDLSPYSEAGGAVHVLALAICDQEPTAPSRRSEKSNAVVAIPRQALAGDLDAIVLKALRKKAEDRYGSVDLLVRDLRAFLEGRPVEARKGSRLYRSLRFSQRHRYPIAAALLVFALVLGWALTLFRQLGQTRVERDTAREVTELLVGLFEVADPTAGDASEVKAREVIDRAALRLETELAGRPEVRAELLETLGRVYTNLALFDKARQQFDRALVERQAAGEDPLSTLYYRGVLATRRTDPAAARPDLEKALVLARAAGARSPVKPSSIHAQLSSLCQNEADFECADQQQRLALEDPSLSPVERAEFLAVLAWIGQQRTPPTDFEATLAEAEALLSQAPADQAWAVGVALNNIGAVLSEARQYERAERLLTEALAFFRSRSSGDHDQIADTLNSLGFLQFRLGDYGKAATTFRESYEMVVRLSGAESVQVCWPLTNLGLAQLRAGDPLSAEKNARESLRIYAAKHPESYGYLAIDEATIAEALEIQGHYAEAAEFYRRAFENYEKGFGKNDRRMATVRIGQARLAVQAGRLVEAEAILSSTLASINPEVVSQHLNYTTAKRFESELRLLQRRPVEAAAAASAALEKASSSLPAAHPRLAELKLLRGRALLELGQRDQALVLLREALAGFEAKLGPLHPSTVEARSRLEQALAAANA
jgi:eukaryotic-like serine/threonine-protein kinase